MKPFVSHFKIAAVAAVVAAAAIAGIVAVVRLDTTGGGPKRLGDAFVYDIDKLAAIDPQLITYRMLRTFETGLAESRAIAAGPGGAVYAAGDRQVRIFDKTGRRTDLIEIDGTPTCLAISGGRLYVGVRDRVEVYSGTQRTEAWPKAAADSLFSSIAAAGGDVFVADAGNRVVLRYNRQGSLVGRIGERDPERNVPGLVVPSPYLDVAVGPDGLLRAANPGRLCIEAYTSDGYLEFSWGKPSSSIEGFCGCCNPVNFAMFAGGRYVTFEKGLQRVKIYNADGSFGTVAAGPQQLGYDGARPCRTVTECGSGGFDVAVDDEQNVLVLDTVRNVVRIFCEKTK